jgi:hypothetical protein
MTYLTGPGCRRRYLEAFNLSVNNFMLFLLFEIKINSIIPFVATRLGRI